MKTIIGFLNSYCEGISGGDVRFIELFKRFADSDKIIITSSLGKKTCELNGLNCRYLITTNEGHVDNVPFTYLLRVYKSLLLKMDVNDGDILYSSSDFLPDIVLPAATKFRKKNVKWILCIFLVVPALFRDYNKRFTAKNDFSVPTLSRLLYFLSQWLTISLAKRIGDKIFVLNELDRIYLINEKGVEDSKIHVVCGGIDYYYLKNLPSPNVKYDGVFLARFHPQKGIFDLVNIWKIVCNALPEAKLCIIGGGTEDNVKDVKDYIAFNDLKDNIDLVGPKFGEEKYRLLKSSKIFLWPSYYESFAIVIAEAMACGLPIVAYDLPIYKEIYKDNLIKIPIGDVGQFAHKTIALLHDNKSIERLAIRNRDFVEKYDWNSVASEELDILNSISDTEIVKVGATNE